MKIRPNGRLIRREFGLEILLKKYSKKNIFFISFLKKLYNKNVSNDTKHIRRLSNENEKINNLWKWRFQTLFNKKKKTQFFLKVKGLIILKKNTLLIEKLKLKILSN